MDRTNETSTGYTYGGQTYKKESRIDAQGNTYTVDIPVSNVIPVSSLTQPAVQIRTPQPAQPVNYTQQTLDITSPYMEQSQMQGDPARQQSEMNDYQALSRILSGKSAFEAEQNQALGLNTANEEYIRKSAELAALNKQAAAAQQENIAQGRQLGSVASFVAGQGSEIERNRAIRALTIGAELDAIQGNIAVAQMKVKNAVDAKYAPIEAELKLRKEFFDMNDKLMQTRSQAEQKQWERAKYAIERQDKKIAEEKKNFEDIQNMIIEATPNAPKNIIANAKKIAEQGGSKLAVAQALGEYAGDYWGTKLKIAQYNKLVSETAKIDKQISGLKLQPTGLVTTPNGDAVSLPNSTLNAIGQLKLNEGQSNAVAFVSRMIQADAAIKKQLGTISPTGGFYETSGYDPTSLGSSFGRAIDSDNSRIYNTNAQDFIRAKLRKESGATITPEEFTADAAIYTPSGVGLDQKDLLLADTKREEAIKSMIAQAGPAAPYLQQYYEQVKANNGVPYDPYLDGQALPSVSKNSGTAMSSDAYANSLITP